MFFEAVAVVNLISFWFVIASLAGVIISTLGISVFLTVGRRIEPPVEIVQRVFHTLNCFTYTVMGVGMIGVVMFVITAGMMSFGSA